MESFFLFGTLLHLFSLPSFFPSSRPQPTASLSALYPISTFPLVFTAAKILEVRRIETAERVCFMNMGG